MRNGIKTAAYSIAVVLGTMLLVCAAALLLLRIRTASIHDDRTEIFREERYTEPVRAEGVVPITQKISCGYAVIEMFSRWNGGDLTEEALYADYGKVVTSTGRGFCTEMNRRFPQYETVMRRYLTDTELIGTVYDTLSEGIPVPVEWAAKYENEWTLHYSLITGMDIPNDRITVANPYGRTEEVSVDEFLDRTSFEAFEPMPLFLRLGFAFGLFEKNTVFTIRQQ